MVTHILVNTHILDNMGNIQVYMVYIDVFWVYVHNDKALHKVYSHSHNLRLTLQQGLFLLSPRSSRKLLVEQ